MSAQLSLSALPVADPAWAEQVEAERRAEQQQREREELVRRAGEICDLGDFFGLVSIADLLKEIEGPPGATARDAPAEFRRLAARLRDLARRGMLVGQGRNLARRLPTMWTLPTPEVSS